MFRMSHWIRNNKIAKTIFVWDYAIIFPKVIVTTEFTVPNVNSKFQIATDVFVDFLSFR